MSGPVVRIDPEGDRRWNRFVENHPFGGICHLAAWKQSLEASFPHMKGHYLALLDDEGGAIRAALPLFEVRSWLTGNRLVSIPFASVCDPLITTSEDFSRLLDEALALAETKGISRAEIRSFRTLSVIQDDRVGQGGRYTIHTLSLAQGAEALWKQFHRSCIRQKISRANQNGLVLRAVTSPSDFEAFYRLYVSTRRRLCLPPLPRAFFENLWAQFSGSNHIFAFLALKNDKPVAGLMLFRFQDRVSAEFGVSDHASWDLNPNHFLFWEAIQWACREGFKTFDFGRTSPSNHDLMEFKRRWGTQESDLVELHYPRRSQDNGTAREASPSYVFMRRLCQYVPGPMFERFGNFCYQHAG